MSADRTAGWAGRRGRNIRKYVYDRAQPRRVQHLMVRPDEVGEHLAPGALATLLVNHDGRLVHKKLHYVEIYERHLGGLRAGFPFEDGSRRALRFLEIGVAQGGSLELWRKYLGPDAVVFGIDVDPRCATLDSERTPVRVGSQADPDFLAAVVREMGGVDVVLDDGSHQAKHQRATFDILFPLLPNGGLYIVEDLNTSYYTIEYGGGFRRPGTFIEVAKSLVDGMHAWYHRWPLGRRARLARDEVGAIHFYDSVVVIEKRARSRPAIVRIGERSW
jgi:hypothetical protein